MKKAVIETGGKQYLVVEGQNIQVELLHTDDKKITFQPLLIIDDGDTKIGQPYLDKASVVAEIIEADVQSEKVTAIRYKAKKRVHKVHGHRQHQSQIKITSIKV